MTSYESATAAPPPLRTSTRAAVSFEAFVLDYAREQRRNVFLSFTGIATIAGAIMRTGGTAQIVLCAFGLGLAVAGLAALALAADAHAAYTRLLATATVTTYATPPPASPGVRAFVPSTNGTQTIRAGKFKLDAAQWVKLFQTAGDGGRLTRDGAAKVLPRELYRAWGDTLGELARLGIVDDSGIITPAGWTWYKSNVSPYSTEGASPSGAISTHARRTHGRQDADGAGVA